MGHSLKKISAAFYKTASGREPVREWLKSLPRNDRHEIGKDIATVEYGWPIGMPVCRALGSGLWEVRSILLSHRISRVIFCITNGHIVLLHGFIKKDQKTPDEDLSLARQRMKEVKS
jgi:phage-related protein